MAKALLMNVKEVAKTLGISESRSYKLIQDLNEELKAKGYITLSGRISRYYFAEKAYGYAKLLAEEEKED